MKNMKQELKEVRRACRSVKRLLDSCPRGVKKEKHCWRRWWLRIFLKGKFNGKDSPLLTTVPQVQSLIEEIDFASPTAQLKINIVQIDHEQNHVVSPVCVCSHLPSTGRRCISKWAKPPSGHAGHWWDRASSTRRLSTGGSARPTLQGARNVCRGLPVSVCLKLVPPRRPPPGPDLWCWVLRLPGEGVHSPWLCSQ